MVKKCDIWPRFSITVAFKALWLQKGATHPKSKTCIGNVDDWRLNNDTEIKPILLLLFTGVKNAKFDI